MRKFTIVLMLVTFSSVVTLSAVEIKKSKSIFNGKDFTGWKVPKKNPWWTIKDNILSVKNDPKKKGSILWTEKKYKDFIVELEFKMGEGVIDSGVFLRNNKEQIQIGISGSLKRDMTCSPYISGKGYPVEAEGIKELLKPKDWNKLKIQAKGKEYTAWLNGKKVMTHESDTAIERGPIGLQLHAGKIMKIDFKDIKVTELP